MRHCLLHWRHVCTESDCPHARRCGGASPNRPDPCAGEIVSRHAVGHRLCDEFGFFDARERPQLAGCLKALSALEARSDRIALPTPQAPAVRPGPHILAAPVSPVEAVPNRLQEIEDLEVVPVVSRSDRRIWNTLIAHEHPQGITTFAGCQLYYLVRCGAWHSGCGRIFRCSVATCGARWLDELERCAASGAPSPGGWPEPFPDPSRCRLRAFGQPYAGASSATPAAGLRGSLWLSSLAGGDVRFSALERAEPAGGEFSAPRADRGSRPAGCPELPGHGAKVGLCLRNGPQVAVSVWGCLRRPCAVAAVRRGSQPCRLGPERVWRSTLWDTANVPTAW